jgi:hypothetical protein
MDTISVSGQSTASIGMRRLLVGSVSDQGLVKKSLFELAPTPGRGVVADEIRGAFHVPILCSQSVVPGELDVAGRIGLTMSTSASQNVFVVNPLEQYSR